jgi:tRNA A37 threonylcarbamoyltransferase TsaD
MTHADRNQPAPTAPPGLLPPDLERRVDFSFSGLKTAVMRVVNEKRGSKIEDRGSRIAGVRSSILDHQSSIINPQPLVR